ncbi:TAXI family TRAP transporter solute-binding subunit [Salipiger sp. IMCC34102]|nr:TAXI family TRAP transporter solute-binding subunit [Salipiger sp. IMCC34102]
MPSLATALLCLSTAASAEQHEFAKNILTGGPTGTYIQIGRDIADLVGACGQTLTVRESAGSLENFLGVRQRPATQFGIVQSDVLEYLRTYSAQDPAIQEAVRGVRIAFPLYNEEVHILASRQIETVGDLDGARVAIGVEDSGTFLTASLLLDLVGAEPAERVTIGPDAALAALQSGDIDAFFYVAGAPTALFSGAQIDAEAFHFVEIDDPVLQSVYTPTTLPAETYPFQAEPVDVVAVKAVLMTYEYNPARNAYHAESCRAVSDVSNLVVAGFETLQDGGHPKWSKVDLNDIPPGWDIGQCVNAGLAPDYVPTCTSNPSPTENGTNAIYRQRICAVIGC